ncbi:ABC transporter ATP-binding protein [Planotetraspora thailandica]|uniref:ABC transporter ATP-binding protein n=1 Tax=Planotetraspora thailandica TaxID=487172 RepID=A0A8J3V1M0_9ACTN|nr:ABC transporter ATP-binding protein [Planotetraspora thailandica]GII56064.1 ABC transporter ATP-binding protein [Planotetraspora thailandica]
MTLATEPVINLQQVARTYTGPPAVKALANVNLTVSRGEYVSVVGPSGSGKSTFLNVLGLLDRPTSGRYLLDGIDGAELSERDRTALRGRRIGFVFQAFHLLSHRTAVENVMLPQLYTGMPRKKRRRQALDMLERVGMAHRAEGQAGQLSGGERQRVAIARALVNGPSLLLCDEPTGNLDSETAATVLQLIDELHSQGLSVLVVTHDSGVARRAQRTVMIKDGKLEVQLHAVPAFPEEGP